VRKKSKGFSRTKCFKMTENLDLEEKDQRTKPITKLAHYSSGFWQDIFITDFMYRIESKNYSSPNYELNLPLSGKKKKRKK
jgi:hypothetical protein